MNLDFRCERAFEGARAFAAAHYNGHECGECRFAQLFAEQDRGECVAAGSEHFGRVMSAACPACHRFEERLQSDVVIARYLAERAPKPTDQAVPTPAIAVVEAQPQPVVAVRWVTGPYRLAVH